MGGQFGRAKRACGERERDIIDDDPSGLQECRGKFCLAGLFGSQLGDVRARLHVTAVQ